MQIQLFTISRQTRALGQHVTAGTGCIARRELAAFTATHLLSEVAHRVMTTEASSLHKWPASGIVARLKQNPGIVQNLTNFRHAVEQIPLYGVHVLVIPAALVATAANVSQQTGLLSNDALIVAVLRTHGLTKLASNDRVFKGGCRATKR